MDEQESITERTARHLQSLYVVGAGLGVAFALEGMIGGVGSDPSLEWNTVPVVVTFLATLIPSPTGRCCTWTPRSVGKPPLF